MRILLRLISKDMLSGMPYLNGLGINLHVFVFATMVMLLAATLFSVAPIARLSLSRVREGLTEGGRSYAARCGASLEPTSWWWNWRLPWCFCSVRGCSGKSFYRLLHVDIGFQPDHLATVTLNLSDAKYSKDKQIVPVVRQILQRTGSLPGVQSVGLTTMLPVGSNGNTNWIRVVGHPYNGEHNEVNERSVSPQFFSTLRAKLLRGRYFTEADDASKPPVIIINQKLASMYLHGEDPIGKKIGDNQLTAKSIAEIVGVVGRRQRRVPGYRDLACNVLSLQPGRGTLISPLWCGRLSRNNPSCRRWLCHPRSRSRNWHYESDHDESADQ